MDVMLWVVAGGALAWIAFSFLDWNPARGLIVSAIIGVGAAFLGGNVLAPALDTSTIATDAGAFSLFALIVAAVTALVFLKVADMLYERYQF